MKVILPINHEVRIALIKSIANSVIGEVMPARVKHGLSSTDDSALVRAIVDKAYREIEELAEPHIQLCETCGEPIYESEGGGHEWADGVMTCGKCGGPSEA